VWRFAVSGVPSLSEGFLQSVTRWLRRADGKPSLEDARAIQMMLVQRIEAMFGDADVLLSPTVSTVAPPIAEFTRPDDPESWFKRAAQLGGLTAPFNLTTGPAASLPLGLTESGLPYGIQIGSHVGNDQLLFSLSRQLERALPWRQRRSPLAAD